MNIDYQLYEVQRLMIAALERLSIVIDSQQPPVAGRPPFPPPSKSVERELWAVWLALEHEAPYFTAIDARRYVVQAFENRPARPVSTYSAILSRWAKQGHIRIVKKGSGRRPTRYKI